MIHNLFKSFFALILLSFASFSWADYATHPSFAAFSQEMQDRYHFQAEELTRWFSSANKQDEILAAISKPAEQSKTWGAYRNIFLTSKRTEEGIVFWQAHQETLNKASETYQVPASIIVAIIGVETFYGKNTGRYRVIDALSTLAFDYPPRSNFFRGELAEFLLMARENHLDPLEIKGSYAGAMGYSQFIPSSYRHYAVDMNQDKKIDLQNPDDAIGSVAHYFQKNGWKKDGIVAVTAQVEHPEQFTIPTYTAEKPTKSLSQWAEEGIKNNGETQDLSTPAVLLTLQIDNEQKEYWLGFNNFYTITRYNRSPLYAMAVYQLSQQLEKSMAQPSEIPAEKPHYIYHKIFHI